MCLLIALSGVVPDAPLIMAANRDERYARPTTPMTVLRDAGPRILGGRDELAGGTWLAVNEHGLVAGLTNQPSPAGRDATRRSRGELPLAFAAYRRADEAVAAVCAALNPADYNPCWLLVGDRHSLYWIGLSGGSRPEIEQLPPGLYVLENAPLRADSAKAAQVARMVADARAVRAAAAGPDRAGSGRAGWDRAGWDRAGSDRAGSDRAGSDRAGSDRAGSDRAGSDRAGSDRAGSDRAGSDRGGAAETAASAADALASVLRDHRPAAGPPAPPPARPPAASAACVHTPEMGTRCATVITIPAGGPPLVRTAEGPPCQVPLQDVTGLWAGPALV